MANRLGELDEPDESDQPSFLPPRGKGRYRTQKGNERIRFGAWGEGIIEGDSAKRNGAPTLDEIFREYAPRIFHLARRMLGNDADAEDVTQDVLLQLVRKLDTFRGESAFPTWLHRVTVNAAQAFRRKRAVREEGRSHEPLDQVAEAHDGPVRAWSVQPDRQALDAETSAVIERAIAKLPELYRDVYVLADVEGLPNAEVGEIMGLSLPAVKSRLHRARLLMRDALAPYFEEAVA